MIDDFSFEKRGQVTMKVYSREFSKEYSKRFCKKGESYGILINAGQPDLNNLKVSNFSYDRELF